MSFKQSLLAVLWLVTALLCGCGGDGGGGGQTAAPPQAPQPPPVFSSGKWSAEETIGNAGNTDDSVAVDSLGTTTLVLSVSSPSQIAVKTFRKTLHAPWGTGETLAAAPAQAFGSRLLGDVQVRVDDAGNAFAAWTFLDRENVDTRSYISTVSVRRREAGSGLWGAEVLLQTDPAAFAEGVHIAVDGDGTAWAVWTERVFKDPLISLQDRYRVFARKFSPPSTWSEAEPVSPEFTGDFMHSLRIAARVSTDKRGNPRVLIRHQNFVPSEDTLYFASRTSTAWSGLTELARVPPLGGFAPDVSDYDLAVDQDDNAIVIWRQHDGTRYVILARRLAAGMWGVPTLLMLPSRDNGHAPRLAMDMQGNALVLWHEFDGVSFAIWAAHFSKASGWDRLDIISSEAATFGDDSTFPRVGFDSAGNAVAVWMKYDFAVNGGIVRANYYDTRNGWGTDETISRGVSRPLELGVASAGFATAAWWVEINNSLVLKSATRIP